MPKKVRTTPIQRDILWSLAETGERSLPSLLDSLQSKFLNKTSDELLRNVTRSLGILYRMGCIYLLRQYAQECKTVLADEMQALSLDSMLEWDSLGQRWVVRKQEPIVNDIVVQLTRGGVEVLQLIAEQSSEPTPIWRPKHKNDQSG